MTPKKEMTPAENEGQTNNRAGYISSLPLEQHGLVTGVYVAVISVGEHNPERWRRTTYFSLKAAQRALDKATANGKTATIGLYQLIPVGDETDN